MAVDIPVIDQPGNRGLMRSKWFPFALSEPSTFLVVMLLATTHYIKARNSPIGAPDILQMKQRTLHSINHAISDPCRVNSDQLLGAVAKMASYEAIFGDQKTYHIHMSGLLKMLRRRGGLSTLGLNGLLARMFLWIDFNASYLHNGPLYFTEAIPVPIEYSELLDPDHFLGTPS